MKKGGGASLLAAFLAGAALAYVAILATPGCTMANLNPSALAKL